MISYKNYEYPFISFDWKDNLPDDFVNYHPSPDALEA